ncbi:hypothetical protein [Nitrospira sp. Nam74]
MNEPRRRLLMALLLMGTGMVLCAALDGRAQNFSGLNGQELQARKNTEADLGVLLGGLFNKGNKVSGNITRVVVKHDSERQLVLSVSSSQLDNKVLWGELRDQDGKRQTQILTSSTVVPAGSTSTDLVFNLDEKLPKETQLNSASVQLYVASSSNSPPGLVRSYDIAKKWQMEIRPENIVTIIAPQPIEEAAQLTERPVITVMPAKKLSPQVMREGALLMPKLMLPDRR